MKIDLSRQLNIDAAFPIGPVRVFTGYALPIELIGIPRLRNGYEVAGVTVKVTNADGVQLTAAAVKLGTLWHTQFAASSFVHYGEITNGISVELTLKKADGSSFVERIGVGQLIVVSASASASPGSPSTFYVVKGDRCFVRSRVVEGVQHFVEQTMEFDAAIGWGANWSGDYILSADGEFINQEEV